MAVPRTLARDRVPARRMLCSHIVEADYDCDIAGGAGKEDIAAN